MPIVPVLEGQGEAGEDNAKEYHDEHTADIVNAYTVALAVLSVAVLPLGVLLPPFVFQLLQFSSVQKYQDPSRKGETVKRRNF